jgi:methionine-rich copper-binding protein CopC
MSTGLRPTRWRPLRVLLLGPLVLLGLVVGAGTAFAHNVLVGSDPADGASLDTGPRQITLRFDLPVQSGFNVVTVIGPDGGHYENGAPDAIGAAVTADVHPLGPAGKYTVGYRVVSDDGHPVSGSVSFTLTRAGTGHPVAPAAAPGAPSAPAAAESTGDGGMPAWPWIVGAVLLVAAGAAVALRAGRD